MGKLHIDLLNTSFTIQANEDEEYLKKLLGYYSRIIDDVSKIPSIRTPLQTSILAGIMLCDELYKEKTKVAQLSNGKPVTVTVDPATEASNLEVEKRTLAMIEKISKVL